MEHYSRLKQRSSYREICVGGYEVRISSLYGYKAYYKKNKVHRLGGPAVEWENGNVEWYFEGSYVDCDSQEDFERLIKLRALW